MVLPDRIELSTSPLPMECSTTELRQHARYSRNRPEKAPTRRPVLATRAPLAQARGRAGKGPKSSKSGACCRRAPSKRSTRKLQGRSGSQPSLAGVRTRRIMTSRMALRRHVAGHCGDGAAKPTMFRRARVAGGVVHRFDQGIFGGRTMKGDQGKACGKERRGCEGFTTGPAEAGAARKSQAAEVAGAGAQRCRRIFRKRRCLPR